MEVEYRIVPVTRYVVTRYHLADRECGCDERGEFSNQDIAYEVANALAEAERQRLGYALDDPRIKYPIVPGSLCNPKKPAA
jgi:hypothetical protein